MNKYYPNFATQSMTTVQILQITVVGWTKQANAGSNQNPTNTLLLQDLEAGVLLTLRALQPAMVAM
jgi:hypothetical protein